ncbi:haloacid dehalogenase-like hydrolase [Pseudonocardia aurantiaca]|uniref:Haloacid dehalogenase-like hydrolase n=1 Tax=Pseudonocardia aurantiaca TaxID=75290 RepID=A0ABW4FM22_9PSEU
MLVLWDIDHTLIETRGVGFAIYQRAFPTATGRPLDQLAQIAGRTELDIMRETLRVNEIEPTDDAIDSLAAALIQGYNDARNELATIGRALPGAAATLRQLATDPRVHQAVLTGNLRDVARIKLETYGLDTYLDLDASAYGDDHADRTQLVAIAQLRATGRTGITFDNAHTVLIGDTPNDIKAATAAGVHVIGVATGKSTADDLIAAGAPVALTDLTDPARTAGLILNPPGVV